MECRDGEHLVVRNWPGRLRGAGPTRASSAPVARRRAAQHRLPARGGEGRLRHLGRGRAREGDRRPGRGRSRDAVPALPAALGPGQGRAPARDRRLRRRGPCTGRSARAGSGTRELAPPVHRVPRDQTGLATALHSGDPAFDALPGYFYQRLEPALGSLLDAAATTGEIRADISARDLLRAVALLCTPVSDEGIAYSQRMVTLLIDGLRCAPNFSGPANPQVRGSTSRDSPSLRHPEQVDLVTACSFTSISGSRYSSG